VLGASVAALGWACESGVCLSVLGGGVLVLLVESEAALVGGLVSASLFTVSCVSGLIIASGLRSLFCKAACQK
jgi:hypothetical protein